VQTFASSQVYPRLFEVGNPILRQHNQDVVSQMKYTTVVYFQECWCMSLLFPPPGCEPPLPVMLYPIFIFSTHLGSDTVNACCSIADCNMQWLHLSPSLVSWVVLAVCHSPASVLQLFLCFKQLFSLNWLSGSGISFLFKSVLAHPFLMQSINPSLVCFSIIKSCSFWVFKCFSFSLSFWSSSKFSFAPAS